MRLDPTFNQLTKDPAMVSESHQDWFNECLTQLAEDFGKIEEEHATDADFWDTENYMVERFRPYVVKEGILHVPVRGALINNFPYQFGSRGTGYEYIWEAVKRGLGDDAVKGIALVIDSPGGLVAGNSELVDKIYARIGEKPIRAYAAESAYSAAYAIASVADSITVARSGGVGSIGVVIVHMEQSAGLQARGINVTVVRSKPGKMETNQFEPLSQGAQERLQARVDASHKQFVALVARNRGMTEKQVDNTNALTFMPQDAIDAGLADEIGSLEDALTAFAASFDSDEGDDTMADKSQAETIPLADHTAALAAAVDEAKNLGNTEGRAQGVADERARVKTILASDAGKARPKAALSVALTTPLSADEAAEFLSTLDEEKAAAPAPAPVQGAGAPEGMLTAAMAGTENPEIGAGTEANAENSTEDKTAKLSANIKAFGLPGFKHKES